MAFLRSSRFRIARSAACLVAGGLAVSACSANTTQDDSDGRDAGAENTIQVINNAPGFVDKVEFTANAAATSRADTPHCSYPVGGGGNTTVTSTGRIVPGDTVVAGILENKNTSFSGCMGNQSYVGLTVVYQGKPYYGLLQTSGPSIGNVSEWVANQDVGASNPPKSWVGSSTFSAQSPILLSGNTNRGITVVINGPTEITDPGEAKATLDEYCGTTADVTKNCDMPTVTSTTPAESEYVQYGARVKNCSTGATNAVDKTVTVTQSYRTESRLDTSLGVETSLGIEAVASVKITATKQWGTSWGNEVSFSESVTVKLDPGKQGGFYVQNGYFDVTGDFVITKPDRGYQKFVIKNFRYTLPAKAGWPTKTDTTYTGIKVDPINIETRTSDCSARAVPGVAAKPPNWSVQKTFKIK